MSLVRKWWGGFSVVVALIGLIDLPGQLNRWSVHFAWLAQLSSDQARWAFVGSGTLMALFAHDVHVGLWRRLTGRRSITPPAGRASLMAGAPRQDDPVVAALDALATDLASARQARTAPGSDNRLSTEDLAEAIFGPPFKVREERARDHLLLWLHPPSTEPLEHLGLTVLGLDRWVPEHRAYAPVPQFADAKEEWRIALSGGERRLHYDAPAPYALCALGGGQPHVQYVIARGRHGCALGTGVFRVSLRFSGDGHTHDHVSFIRVDGANADFSAAPS